ncbi:hypothetical protein H8356DRAFT_1295674 [Neocallimastix lanati (nom. inval.)]|nr:hypothetical protein H8356DRAFT_1295674 [Neocallimastix sp. JGI-2020a]
MLKINPLFDKIESNNKLYYLRMSFKQYYPSIYERLTYAVVKDEEVNIIKQIIEFYYLEEETNTLNTKKNLREIRSNNQPYDAQPLYKKRCLLCGSTEHVLYQCNMKDSFFNWKKNEKEKLKEKERRREL